MTPFVMPLLLVVALVLAAAAGPHLIRAASPLLMRTPRAAVVILASSLALWVAAFAAVERDANEEPGAYVGTVSAVAEAHGLSPVTVVERVAEASKS